MNASQEIVQLLADIADARCGRNELARWLAEHSLRFLESTNSLDGAIVTDLDAALGEVQREAERERYLRETAWRIVQGLGLSLPVSPTIGAGQNSRPLLEG